VGRDGAGNGVGGKDVAGDGVGDGVGDDRVGVVGAGGVVIVGVVGGVVSVGGVGGVDVDVGGGVGGIGGVEVGGGSAAGTSVPPLVKADISRARSALVCS
jgi:hypothetical protein